MQDETKQWLEELKKSGELSDEAVADLTKVFEASPKADEFVKGSALRQSDYDKHMDKLKTDRETQEKEYAAKNTEVETFRNSLVDFKTTADKSVEEANQKAASATQQLADSSRRVGELAAQYGIDDAELKTALAATPSTTPAPGVTPVNGNPAPDALKGYVTEKTLNEYGRVSVDVSADLNDMADKHFDLFGTRLSRRELQDEALKTGKTLTEVWEQKYSVSERRDQLAKESQEAHDKKIRDDAVTETEARVRSDMAMPPQARRDPNSSSPILNREFKPEIGPENPQARQQRVLAAVESYNRGENRPQEQQSGTS